MTVQTFLKAAQAAGLAHNSGAGGEFILAGTGRQLEALERALQGDGGYVPGVMRCDRCKFEVTRMNLNVNVGTVTAGNSEPEPCPNGCGPLRPTTWKEHAEAAFAGVDALLERAEKAEKAEKALAAAVAPQVAQFDSDSKPLNDAARTMAKRWGIGDCLGKSDEAPTEGSSNAGVAPSPMLGEVWMAFGQHEGSLIALPEYAAASANAVGEKIMDGARREGYRGSLRDRLASLDWSLRRVTLADADGVPGCLCGQPISDECKASGCRWDKEKNRG